MAARKPRIGERNRRITLQRPQTATESTHDEYGELVVTTSGGWVTVGTKWAAVTARLASAKPDAERDQAPIYYDIDVLYDPTIANNWRVQLDGKTLRVVNSTDLLGTHTITRIQCEELQ